MVPAAGEVCKVASACWGHRDTCGPLLPPERWGTSPQPLDFKAKVAELEEADTRLHRSSAPGRVLGDLNVEVKSELCLL